MPTYLGDGTEGNPYIISTPEEFAGLWDGSAQFGFYELVNDIDMDSIVISGTSAVWTSAATKLDLKGKTVSNIKYSGVSDQSYCLAEICNGTLDFTAGSSGALLGGISSGGDNIFVNVVLSGSNSGGGIFGTAHTYLDSFFNCVFLDGSDIKFSVSYTRISAVDSYSIGSAAQPYRYDSINVVAAVDQFDSANFPLLTDPDWEFGNSLPPRRAFQSYQGLPITRVVGKTLVDGVAKQRSVVALSEKSHSRIAKTESSALTGEFNIPTSPFTSGIMIIAFDEFGDEFKTNFEYQVGDIAHITPSNGYRYICTTAGTSAATVPSSYPTSSDLTFGTAVFTPQIIDAPSVITNVQAESIV